MLEELHTASSLLRIALERYARACAALHDGCLQKDDISDVVDLQDAVTSELDLVESYQSRLNLAHIKVKKARNNVANIPINSLPAEIITHIFHLVVAEQPCSCLAQVSSGRGPFGSLSYSIPKYPDLLSHVCSHWRQIAFASPSIWSHIDILLSCPLSQASHERAATYVARAHQTPLNIHFMDPGLIHLSYDLEGALDTWDASIYANKLENFTFLASSPAPQIRSLGLRVTYNLHHPIHNRALEYCLASCLPKGLSELIIDTPFGAPDPFFFEGSLDLQIARGAKTPRFNLLLSEQQLETVWYPITTLTLKGRYPPWTSSAYYNLTELRIFGRCEVSSSDLSRILGSSPGLRTLHGDFHIKESLEIDTSATPIKLQALENLNLRGMHETDVEYFLRIVDFGPMPLRLSLWADPTFALLEDFFARSNVQEMWTESIHQGLSESELTPSMFCLPSRLRTLVIDNWCWGPVAQGEATRIPLGSHSNNPVPREVHTLYMLSCRFNNFAQFRETIANLSPQRLILWKCGVLSHPDAVSFNSLNMSLLESTLGEDLSQLCPSIKCLAYADLNPLRGWD